MDKAEIIKHYIKTITLPFPGSSWIYLQVFPGKLIPISYQRGPEFQHKIEPRPLGPWVDAQLLSHTGRAFTLSLLKPQRGSDATWQWELCRKVFLNQWALKRQHDVGEQTNHSNLGVSENLPLFFFRDCATLSLLHLPYGQSPSTSFGLFLCKPVWSTLTLFLQSSKYRIVGKVLPPKEFLQRLGQRFSCGPLAVGAGSPLTSMQRLPGTRWVTVRGPPFMFPLALDTEDVNKHLHRTHSVPDTVLFSLPDSLI